LLRERFIDAGSTCHAHARRILALLLAQDGSTTRLCETIAGGRIELRLQHQAPTIDVPAAVHESLPGTRFIERITSLAAHGQVMMDNLTYIALDGLDASLQNELEAGLTPIGHMLARMWVQRETMPASDLLHERLWDAVGLPDRGATRTYRIVTPEGPRMLIVETYRRGMLMQR